MGLDFSEKCQACCAHARDVRSCTNWTVIIKISAFLKSNCKINLISCDLFCVWQLSCVHVRKMNAFIFFQNSCHLLFFCRDVWSRATRMFTSKIPIMPLRTNFQTSFDVLYTKWLNTLYSVSQLCHVKVIVCVFNESCAVQKKVKWLLIHAIYDGKYKVYLFVETGYDYTLNVNSLM